MPMVAAYGSWRSVFTADLVARGGVGLLPGWMASSDGSLYWMETRPDEGGRDVLVRRAADGSVADAIPRDLNARTRVHEYGGGAAAVRGATVVVSSFAGQRLYRIDGGGAPAPITPEPPGPAAHRYADGVISPDGARLVCVRERHDGSEVVNEIVSLPLDGSAPPRVLASGHDFFSSPSLAPDGRRLAWLSWDHPNMPWDGSDLFVAEVRGDGTIADPVHVAGGRDESIFQPAWGPDGGLYFASDRTGWWNLYRLDAAGAIPLAPMDAEFGLPQWRFGASTYTFLADGRIACFYVMDGIHRLAVLDPRMRTLAPLAPDLTWIAQPTRIGD